MKQTVKMPKLGDTADEVVVLQWYVQPGAEVVAGQPVLRVETDKVEVDVEAPVAGRVLELLVGEGDDVQTGAPVLVVEGRGHESGV